VVCLSLIRINEVVDASGISSRTLRYYEEVGLLWSNRVNGAQRHYDSSAIERLRQIMVLRKMQIPIKDIIAIFKNQSMAVLTQTFVDKLTSLDTEISALSELRQLVNEFMQQMTISGITKITALPLLYEETEKRLAIAQTETLNSFEKLAEINQNALKLNDIRMIRLPPMRMITSRLKSGKIEELDGDKLQNMFIEYNLLPQPGMRDCFMQKETGGEWLMMLKVPQDYNNQTPYQDTQFSGGLYAITSSYFENMDDTWRLLKEWVTGNQEFEADSERMEMIEEILPWDIARSWNKYQQDIYIPINLKGENHERLNV